MLNEMEQKPVGVAGSMPGTTGFTIAVFKAAEVPDGTKVYAAPFTPVSHGIDEPAYYSKGKDCEFYEKLSDKDFAWEATKMAQDLADMDTRGLEDILPFVGVLSIAADRVEKLSAAADPALWNLPSWWKPSQKLAAALNAYREVKADFEAFDGDRRGIGAAMSERAFAIIDVIAKEHFENDDSDNNCFIVSRMVEVLIANLPPAAGYSDVK